MIFNWKDAINIIRQNKKYFDTDRFDQKIEYRQQIFLITQLIIENKTKNECYQIWKEIPNQFLMANTNSFDIITHFNHLYQTAQTNVENLKKYDKDIKITIYQEEIDSIKQLIGGLEFQKYIFVLLCIIKFYNAVYGYCTLSTSLRSYAFELATGKKYYNYSRRLDTKNKQNGFIIQTIVNNTVNKKTFNKTTLFLLKNSGKIALELNTPDEITNYFDLLPEPEQLCPQCGNYFKKNNKSKTNLCPDCYKTYHKKYHNNIVKQKRQKNKKNNLTNNKN